MWYDLVSIAKIIKGVLFNIFGCPNMKKLKPWLKYLSLTFHDENGTFQIYKVFLEVQMP